MFAVSDTEVTVKGKYAISYSQDFLFIYLIELIKVSHLHYINVS
jgi:hypothetical protein